MVSGGKESGPLLRFGFPLSANGGSAGIPPPGSDGTCILGRKMAGGLTGRVDGRANEMDGIL